MDMEAVDEEMIKVMMIAVLAAETEEAVDMETVDQEMIEVMMIAVVAAETKEALDMEMHEKFPLPCLERTSGIISWFQFAYALFG